MWVILKDNMKHVDDYGYTFRGKGARVKIKAPNGVDLYGVVMHSPEKGVYFIRLATGECKNYVEESISFLDIVNKPNYKNLKDFTKGWKEDDYAFGIKIFNDIITSRYQREKADMAYSKSGSDFDIDNEDAEWKDEYK